MSVESIAKIGEPMFRRNRIAMQNNVLSASQIEVLAKANQLVANNNSADVVGRVKSSRYARLLRQSANARP